MIKKILQKPKLIFLFILIALFLLFLLYYTFVINPTIKKNTFTEQVLSISDGNNETIFSVQKILIYGSANVKNSSSISALENLEITQFTDISIQIDNLVNSDELTGKNTIKELYIDNIVTKTNIGINALNYKDPNMFGVFTPITNAQNNRIDFNIINSNEENSNANYSDPTFYMDCSNPITIGFSNSDLISNYSVTDNSKKVTYDGTILREANLAISDLNPSIELKINIINNLDEKFVYNMKLELDYGTTENGIYNGYIYQSKDTSGDEYRFFKEF